MQSSLAASIADLLEHRTGRRSEVRRQQPVSGGCIHDARLLTTDDGRHFFLKVGGADVGDAFEREAEGLRALERACSAIARLRVPEVVGTDRDIGDGGAHRFLLLEAIEEGSRHSGFSADFGSTLAALHRAEPPKGSRGRWGFEHDNHIGATPQANGWMDGWTDFWRERRFAPMMEKARERGLSDPELDRLADHVIDRLKSIIGDADEPPSLLHGDLWGGNYLVDTEGRAVLIDPAAYVGHREADLAMTRLFGGFDAAFYRAYEEAWPLDPGSETRLALYELYHMLNHLLLFGRSYRGGCISRLQRLSRI